MRRALSLSALSCLALVAATAAHSAEGPSLDVENPDLPPPIRLDLINLDARATFLRTHNETIPKNSPAIDLKKLGLKPGDWIRLEVLGDFSWSGGQLPEDARALIGVFSSSATLLPPDQRNRVVDAVDSGHEIHTAATLFFGYPTDIPEDFPIWPLRIQIPAGARFLFIAAPDIYYSDNEDADGNFALRISMQ